MYRRQFLSLGAFAAAGGLTQSSSSTHAAANPSNPSVPAAPSMPAILVQYSGQDHRRRLENIAFCRDHVGDCLRKHLITDYLPGQCVYNLGEYPARKIWDPDDWDERELDALKAQGIELLQVHEEWNDSQRLFGSHKLAAANPAGFRRFVEMVHRRGMKLIVYVSSGYFERNDPDFRESWSGPGDLREIYFRYAHNSAASPDWRAYLLPRLVKILDDYGVDGLYNDLGYRQPGGKTAASDEVLAFQDDPEHDGSLGDLLHLIYAEVKRRGGIVKVHRSNVRAPQTDLKVYDYLWVGEGGRNGDMLREATKNHRPYVVPCLDMSRAQIEREDELYLHALPYMQFPLLMAGRPFTGERAMVPGIQYPPEQKCFWTRHLRAMARHYQEHPQGPHSYGWWDSCPGRPEARPTHARWLKHYRPMVEEGTWAWLEIRGGKLVGQRLPQDVVVSAYANRDLYVVLANYGKQPAQVRLAAKFLDLTASAPAAPQEQWTLAPRSLTLLKKPQA